MTQNATNLRLVTTHSVGDLPGDPAEVLSTEGSAEAPGAVRRVDANDDERPSTCGPLDLVAQIETLLAARHVAVVDRWELLSDQLVEVEQVLLGLPRPQLREAAHALLTLLHQVVENEGLKVEE